ncbi:hypothetical protein DL98DRAFT_589374 [Cadophora sp. DSE1049]|nr:hypothetical protein DL98DRAFT_589374 [Cadophora sp. DSE1049]
MRLAFDVAHRNLTHSTVAQNQTYTFQQPTQSPWPQELIEQIDETYDDQAFWNLSFLVLKVIAFLIILAYFNVIPPLRKRNHRETNPETDPETDYTQ